MCTPCHWCKADNTIRTTLSGQSRPTDSSFGMPELQSCQKDAGKTTKTKQHNTTCPNQKMFYSLYVYDFNHFFAVHVYTCIIISCISAQSQQVEVDGAQCMLEILDTAGTVSFMFKENKCENVFPVLTPSCVFTNVHVCKIVHYMIVWVTVFIGLYHS